MSIIIIESKAVFSDSKKPPEGRLKKRSRKPYSQLPSEYNWVKIRATTTREVIVGMKKEALKKFFPQTGWFRAKARSRANRVVKGSVPITKRKVFQRARKKLGSFNSFLKFSSPIHFNSPESRL